MKNQSTNYPVSIVPITPEDDRTEFARYQDEFDRSRWQGSKLNYIYPGGGGNNPNSGGANPGD